MSGPWDREDRGGAGPRHGTTGWRYRLNPVRLHWEQPEPPYTTWVILGLCVLVFVYESTLSPRELYGFFLEWGMVPYNIFNEYPAGMAPGGPPAWATAITHMFVHGGLFHLIVNMIAFVSFGRAVEFLLGYARYAVFFFLCGLTAAFTHAFFLPDSQVPMVGASGAIFGVVSCYLLFDPKNKVIFLLLPIPMPLWLLLGVFMILHVIFVVLDIWGGVAWLAHIGGFVAGLVLFPFFVNKKRLRQYRAMIANR